MSVCTTCRPVVEDHGTFKVATGNDQRARDLLSQDEQFTLWDLTDDAVGNVRRGHLRTASDLAHESEIAHSPERAQDLLTRARREWVEAREARDNQLMRFRLRMRYGAVDDHLGTASPDCWYRHGTPPSYRLAMALDRQHAASGRRHTLTWALEVGAA